MDDLKLIDTKNRIDMAPENPGPVLDPTFELVRQPKNAETGIRARCAALETIEAFAAWRASKGFPPLSPSDLKRSFDLFRGNPVYEQAIAKQLVERR
jgi:hypothetical protein